MTRRHPDRDERPLLIDELRLLRSWAADVASTPPAVFDRASSAYAVASMCVIRMHAILEDEALDALLIPITEQERRGIRSMRNFAARRGYRETDDRVLWTVVTIQLPAIIDRVLAAMPPAEE